MAITIEQVESGSIADQLGLRPGDRLLSINAERVLDFIDYQALCCAEDMSVRVARDGEQLEFQFQKDEYEPLGLDFGPGLGCLRNCLNHCLFCFVDQLPACARPTMRVKDDDWRMSLLTGSFVTLTNVGEKELSRIIARRASPLYISVHATDDELRCRLLGTPRGAGILKQLGRLAGAGLNFHAQVVVCPGLNDGAALEKTVNDLAALHPAALSLALVPVGLTEHRQGLYPLTTFDAGGARRVLDQVERWQRRFIKELGTAFVYAADEFYLMAGRPFPRDERYEDYPQIENGVGLCRLLQTEFDEAWQDADLRAAKPGKLLIACGKSAAPFLQKMLQDRPIPGVQVEVRALENHLFGATVTVSGLLSGNDLIRQLRDVQADRVLITECMLREQENVFLDGMTLEQVSAALGLPVVPVGRRGDQLLDALMGVSMED